MTQENQVRWGSNYVASETYSDRQNKLKVSFTQNNVISDTKIVIGGVPLSLVDLGSRYALAVIRNTDFIDSGRELNYDGYFYKVLEKNGQYALGIEEVVGGSIGPVSETILGGVSLALNNNNEIICADMLISDVDGYCEVNMGGSPITAVQKNGNWYLLVA